MSQYEKLKTLLKELFQLDQPDLDFGFYRVMRAKSAEVTQFLEKELLPQVKAAFMQYQPADKAAIEKELSDEASRATDVLVRTYEYFLSQFASAEGKKGGEFYTLPNLEAGFTLANPPLIDRKRRDGTVCPQAHPRVGYAA